MLRNYRAAILLVPAALLYTLAASAETQLRYLKNNPFTRPPIPEPQVIVVRPVIVEKVAAVELDLSATMVSEVASMVIVDGELLVIGQSIKGMKLVKVMEGKAEFVQAGKKMTFSIESAETLNMGIE
jgi:hypothetical protein